MKKGKHPHQALSAVQVRNLKKPGFYADGNCLYLKVDENSTKRWIQRVTINGKRHDIGLGSANLVSLAEAREIALNNRKKARNGGDPLYDKRMLSEIATFEETAYKVYKINLDKWRNEKQKQQWINSLKTYVFPKIGSKRIDTITSADILAVLSPIWTNKYTTASRICQRIKKILDWAVAEGWRTDNPVDAVKVALPHVNNNVKRHKSLPFTEVHTAINLIQNSPANLATRLALEMVVLTALRSGEVRNGAWDEVDIKNRVWTIPAERMKKSKEHKVPLSERAIEILQEAESLKTETNIIFPNPTSGKALSDVALSGLLKKLNIACVPHGFRSSFRIWAAERSNMPREVCEFALAHVVGNEAERAYQRSDLYEQRRMLMGMWDRYLSIEDTNIIPIFEKSI